MEGFEGYIGIHLWDGQLVNDVLYLLLSVFLFCFALLFHFKFPVFLKSIKNAFFLKQRSGMFDESVVQRNIFYHLFMSLQGPFLSSLILFVLGWKKGFEYHTVFDVFIMIGGLFVILLLFYLFKQFTYLSIGCIFTSMDKYSLWRTNYNAVFEIWGLSLYLPAIWMVFVGKYVNLAFTIFILLYVFSRFVLIYNLIRIFRMEKYGLLYLSLYLCGQEILPLLFLYKGVIYWYNIVEIGIIWH